VAEKKQLNLSSISGELSQTQIANWARISKIIKYRHHTEVIIVVAILIVTCAIAYYLITLGYTKEITAKLISIRRKEKYRVHESIER